MSRQLQIYRANTATWLVMLLMLHTASGLFTCNKKKADDQPRPSTATTPAPAAKPAPAAIPVAIPDTPAANVPVTVSPSLPAKTDSIKTSAVLVPPPPQLKQPESVPPDTILAGDDTLEAAVVIAMNAKPERVDSLNMKIPNSSIFETGGSNEIRLPVDTLSKDSVAVKDSTALEEKNNTASSGKLLNNTGSSYFTSEVQPILNDQLNSAYTTKLLYDSVIVRSNKEFAYNTITLNNTTGNTIKIQAIITSPKSWNMVTSNIADITLDPFSSSIVPMRMSPGSGNTAIWQDVRIEYRINGVIDSRKNYFRVKVQEYTGFKASLPNANLVLTSYQKTLTIPVTVRNSGNTEGAYTVALENSALGLDTKIPITLPPSKDTVLMVTFPISESRYQRLRKEDVRVAVKNDKGEVISMIQGVSRVGHLLKDHLSAYLEMPLQMEVGTFYNGPESPIQYYGALYGNVDFTSTDRVAFALRSNTIARGQTNNNSIARLDYTGAKWSGSIGNIQGIGEFVVDGYGARLGYQWKGMNKAELYSMLQSRVGDVKVFGAALQTGIKDKIRFNESFSMNIDNDRLMNSAILSQIAEYNFDGGRFALITGAGTENNRNTLVEGTDKRLTGTSAGYNLTWATNKFAVNSNVLYNSNSFPGVFKGQRLQLHDARWMIKQWFLGGFYEYNFRKQNYFQDTVLLKDVFNLRTVNFGGRAGFNFKGGNIVLAAGNQRQLQEGEEALKTNYDYANLITALMLGKLYFNVTTFAGVMSVQDRPGSGAFVMSNQGTLQYKKAGASFRLDNGPYYYQEYVAYLVKQEDYRRIMVSPFVEMRLWKNSFNGRFQANYAQTLPTNVSTTNFIANINYNHPRQGFDFNINGIFPVSNSAGVNTNPYVNAAFRMRVKAPFVAVRKYYNLKLVLFKDANGDGRQNDGEEPVAGQTLSLNGDLFVTNADGTVVYKNTEKGTYKAEFGYSTRLKGWIPSEGNVQHFELNGNKTIEIPYKVSRVLSGKLNVQKDAMSESYFNVANIKVTVTAEKGEVNSTLTDENGEFHFNLPAGNYIVSLSEAAFGDQFKPVEFSQAADLQNNKSVTLYFEIKQRKRQINIKKKD